MQFLLSRTISSQASREVRAAENSSHRSSLPLHSSLPLAVLVVEIAKLVTSHCYSLKSSHPQLVALLLLRSLLRTCCLGWF